MTSHWRIDLISLKINSHMWLSGLSVTELHWGVSYALEPVYTNPGIRVSRRSQWLPVKQQVTMFLWRLRATYCRSSCITILGLQPKYTKSEWHALPGGGTYRLRRKRWGWRRQMQTWLVDQLRNTEQPAARVYPPSRWCLEPKRREGRWACASEVSYLCCCCSSRGGAGARSGDCRS